MEGPISSRNQDRQATPVDPSDVAHHLRVAADKYHEIARVLIEKMSDAVAAVPDSQKNSIREGRESLARLFDEQASDALRLALLLEDIDPVELVAALKSISDGNARKVASDNANGATRGGKKTSADKIHDIRTKLVAGKVNRPAIPEGRDTHATDIELNTDIAGAGENDGSMQRTPTTWVGNELVNRQVGGAE